MTAVHKIVDESAIAVGVSPEDQPVLHSSCKRNSMTSKPLEALRIFGVLRAQSS